MKPFKPLLAEPVEDINKLRYPVLASVKYDGIRCLIRDSVATSRSLKPIPNQFVQSILGKPEFNGLDGELMVNGNFQDVTSSFMSEDGEPDFYYAVFDNTTKPEAPFKERYESLGNYPEHSRIRIVDQYQCDNAYELEGLYKTFLDEGHEGAMIRSIDGPYKFGRSTVREGILLKWKPFADAEATIVGFEERMHNGNEATTNALGRTERSSHKANLVPMGTLGALICTNETLWPGQTFNIGTGFTDAMRREIWNQQDSYKGKLVKFSFQKIGTKDKPRIPVFQSFRDARDLAA